MTNTHFIEITPNSLFNSNREYQIQEEKITLEFINLFPEENISFISDDAFVGIDKVDYEIKGKANDAAYSINNGSYKVPRRMSRTTRKSSNPNLELINRYRRLDHN